MGRLVLINQRKQGFEKPKIAEMFLPSGESRGRLKKAKYARKIRAKPSIRATLGGTLLM
jgi:hypothetical protein